MATKIVSKVDRSTETLDLKQVGNVITLDEVSVVQLSYHPRDVQSYVKEGEDLILTLKSGETIRIRNFFVDGPNGDESELVLEDDDGNLWWGRHSPGYANFQFSEIGSLDVILGSAANEAAAAVIPTVGALAGLAALGGVIILADDDDDRQPDSEADTDADFDDDADADADAADGGQSTLPSSRVNAKYSW
ncbi:MAG: BapA prefix-like domain-containing protein [Gammaproteobacteria bacterium]|nr:MAG: BapA prefix-like domain-containing protein [Gammaproteobacteria bacterium]